MEVYPGPYTQTDKKGTDPTIVRARRYLSVAPSAAPPLNLLGEAVGGGGLPPRGLAYCLPPLDFDTVKSGL